MEEDNINEEQLPEEEPQEEVPQEKINQLKNLKYFRDWSDDKVREYVINRNKQRPKETPKLFTQDEIQKQPVLEEEPPFDEKEYEKKYNEYLKKYLKEYGVDMNDANDNQALQALVRLVIQAEVVDISIRKTQHSKGFDSRTLKNLGDFQRSIQTSITELQDRLGISRKTRKDKQVDDIPQYIRSLQLKAKDFWNRTTTPVTCNKCQIELARYWLNFPANVNTVQFDIVCEKCREDVIYSA